MNNKSKKNYENYDKEVLLNELTFKKNHFESRNGSFMFWRANAELCESCTRYELYIKALRAGVRANYDADTLCSIYHDAYLVRDRINYIIDEIESSFIPYDHDPNSEDVKWYRYNLPTIMKLIKPVEHWLYNRTLTLPHVELEF